MTPAEARHILGLGPDQDPGSRLGEFGDARERIAEMVRRAPNETLAGRYRKGLSEFDEALAVLKEAATAPPAAGPPPVFRKAPASPSPDPEPPVLQPPPLPVVAEERRPAPTVRLAPAKFATPAGPEIAAVPENPSKRRSLAYVSAFLLIVMAATAVGFFYLKSEEDKAIRRQARIVLLEKQGAGFIENRRWPEATAVFKEIESLDPGSELAVIGRNNIEAGIVEEQKQFIAYWTGQAIASLEAGLWQDAESAARQVLDKYPDEKEAAGILERTAEARRTAERAAAIAAIRSQLEARQWDQAIADARSLSETLPEDSEVAEILSAAIVARDNAMANLEKARDLLARAVARDEGQFDQLALDYLREATALAPDDAEIAARLEKMSAYTRTLRVPDDFATPAEALAEARDRDRIVLSGSTWKGPLVINAAVDLQGSGPLETVIECPAELGSALTLGPGAQGSRISGITFRHESFAVGADRFSAALARGADATFSDCRFLDASGHGLAVIEGAHVVANRCRFSGNGWNGVAAFGEGSLLEVTESEATGNFEHGIESWDGAAVILLKNRCEENSRNGIHADNGEASVTIQGNQLVANREFGLVVGSAGSGRISGNTVRDNLLGGLVVRAAAASVTLTDNHGTGNRGPGLVLEKGLSPAAYSQNAFAGNAGKQILANADLAAEEILPETPPDKKGDPSEAFDTPPPAAIIVPEEELRALEEP